jgi:membrane protein
MKYTKLFLRSVIDFFRDGGLMLAGSLSYFSIMALVPLCIFLITVFGSVLGHNQEFYIFFSNKLTNFFPEITSGITEELRKLIAYKGIGKLSLLLYGFLSLQVFASIEHALNIIFEVKNKRTFFWSLLISLFMIMLLFFMLVISFIAASLLPLLQSLKSLYPEIRIGIITGFLIRYIIPFLMVFFTITVSYVFFPKIRVRISHALTGALFSTIFLEIAKHIFTWYVGTVIVFGTIYGPLTAFIVFLLWAFYSSCIFLIGAEIVHNLKIGRQ